MEAVTLDTGALIAVERRRKRIREVLSTAHADGTKVIVPAVTVAEWWRGRTDARERILRMVTIEAMDGKLAKLAGEALASLSRHSVAVDAGLTVDAIVMASAALSGSVVYTQDYDDLVRFQGFFPDVRLLTV